MIKDGALTDPRPDVSLGLHVWNSMPFGELGVAEGPVMSGASIFTVKITGKGGHGASPERSIDPVVCAAQLITAFQTVVSRSVGPLDSAVISVTRVTSGTAFNVIPQEATLQGTVRTFKVEIRDLVERRMREICQGIGAAMGCTIQFEIEHLVLPVTNDPEVSARARQIFASMVGEDKLKLDERTMGSEDVGLFMDDVPGMYFFLGAAVPSPDGNYYGHHHPRFDFDENALPLGVALLSSAVADYMLSDAQ
jgi:amidohydrolase